MRHRNWIIILALLLSATSSFGLITRTIRPSGGGDHTTFQGACTWLESQTQPLTDDYEFVADSSVYAPCSLVAVNTGSRTVTFRPASGTVRFSAFGTGSAFCIESTNNVTLQGLVVNGGDTVGICYRWSTNGIIRACSVDSTSIYGILANRSDNLLIDTCTVHNGNAAGIYLIQSHSALIRRTWIDNSNSDGISINWSRDVRVDSSRVDGAYGYGIRFDNSIRGRVRFARVSLVSSNTGIMWNNSDTARVDSCFIAAGIYGIYFNSSPASVVRRCSVAGSNNGIMTSSSNRVRVDSSSVWADGGYGVNFNTSEGCRVLASSVAGNAASGISMEHSGHDSILQCDVATTGSYAVRVYSTSGSAGNFLANNLLRDWTSAGIYLYNQDSARFYDNTISGPGSGTGSTYGVLADSSANMVAKGNIVLDTSGTGAYAYFLWQNSSFLPGGTDFNDLYCPGGQLVSLNGTIYSNLAAWKASSGNPDTSSISTDPLFVGGSDYSLDSTSPCKRAGTPIPGITTDLFGNLRHVSTPSMGAIEWVPTPPGFFSLLSPANGALNQPLSLKLIWSPSSTADTYLLYLGPDSSSLPIISRQADTLLDSCEGLKRDSSYYWKVAARTNAGGIRTSPCWRFHISPSSPDTPFVPEPPLPPGIKNKGVKNGGCMTYIEAGTDAASPLIYSLKGNKTCEFYRYDVTQPWLGWVADAPIPLLNRLGKKKAPSKGATMTAAGGRIYATKGNGTYDLWEFTPAVGAPGTWVQKEDVPTGAKKVKDGAGAATVSLGGIEWVYLLKGNSTMEFYRYDPTGNAWWPLPSAPGGPKGKGYKSGSAIVYYPDDKDGGKGVNRHIYTLKGSYNELYAFGVDDNSWATLCSLPLKGRSGKKKKAGDGAGLAYHAGTIYAVKGKKTNEFWLYSCAGNTWIQGSDITGAPVGPGGSITYSKADNSLYVFKGGGTNDFCSYALLSDLKTPAFPPSENEANSQLDIRRSSFSIVPNPASSAISTSISYSLRRPGKVSLTLYDISGKLVSTLASGYHPAGNYACRLPPAAYRLSAGVYLLKFETADYKATRKLIVE